MSAVKEQHVIQFIGDSRGVIAAFDLRTPLKHVLGNNKSIRLSDKLKNNGPVVVTSDHRSNKCA